MVGVRPGIPFLDHDDANRALMGSTAAAGGAAVDHRPPIVATGLEVEAAQNST